MNKRKSHFRVFRLSEGPKQARWGATHAYRLTIPFAARTTCYVNPMTGRRERCVYGRSPTEALLRLQSILKHSTKDSRYE